LHGPTGWTAVSEYHGITSANARALTGKQGCFRQLHLAIRQLGRPSLSVDLACIRAPLRFRPPGQATRHRLRHLLVGLSGFPSPHRGWAGPTAEVGQKYDCRNQGCYLPKNEGAWNGAFVEWELSVAPFRSPPNSARPGWRAVSLHPELVNSFPSGNSHGPPHGRKRGRVP